MPELVRELPQTTSDIGALWFLRRAVLAILILSFGIGGIAWLLHASIDTTLEARAAEMPSVARAADPADAPVATHR